MNATRALLGVSTGIRETLGAYPKDNAVIVARDCFRGIAKVLADYAQLEAADQSDADAEITADELIAKALRLRVSKLIPEQEEQEPLFDHSGCSSYCDHITNLLLTCSDREILQFLAKKKEITAVMTKIKGSFFRLPPLDGLEPEQD